jgi:hypothetical protein
VSKYLALIYSDEEAWGALSEDERSAIYGRYRTFSVRPEVKGGSELQPTTAATSAELKEALGGYFVLECDSIDDACALAAQIPAAEHGAIEIRPAYENRDAA